MNNYGQSSWQSGPHGGRMETVAKGMFLAILISVIVAKMVITDGNAPPQLVITGDALVSMQRSAKNARDSFLAKNGEWTALEAAQVRNTLVEMRESLPRSDAYDGFRREINDYLEEVVDAAHAKVERGLRSSNIQERQKASIADLDLRMAYNQYMPKPVVEMQEAGGEILWMIGRFFAFIYILFLPFAFLCYVARMRKEGHSLTDELVFGWKNLLISTVIWPFGMSEYPRDAALALRRHYIEAEFRARLGKDWREAYTRSEERQLEELIMAPKAELQARLNAIAEIPLHVRMYAQTMAFMTVLLGVFMAPFGIARAQTKAATGDGESAPSDPPALIEVPSENWSLDGFVQVESKLPDPTVEIPRAFLFVRGSPYESFRVKLGANVAGTPKVLDLSATWMPSETVPISITVGQIILRSAFLAPAPNQERLIGGPVAAGLMSFFDIGIEVAGKHRYTAWSLAAFSGAGPNVPDDNTAKDVQVWGSIGPFGPFRFQASSQFGLQPDGFRIRTASEATLDLDPVLISLVTAHQLAQADKNLDGKDALAASALVAWRAHTHLDLAAGYDALITEDAPMARTFRAQATAHALESRVQFGATYRYGSAEEKEHAVLGRLQFSF